MEPAAAELYTKRPLLEEDDAEVVLPPRNDRLAAVERAIPLTRRRASLEVSESYALLEADGPGGGLGSSSSSSAAPAFLSTADATAPQSALTQRPQQARMGALPLRRGGEETAALELSGLAVPLVQSAEPPGGKAGPDEVESGNCFICLAEGEPNDELVRCCTTCYAKTHVSCWREWRNNQRVTALRSRLLGLRSQNTHLLQCTICKSGTAVLAGEEGGLGWMNEIPVRSASGDPGGVALGGQVPGGDADEDGSDANLEDLFDVRTCVSLMIWLTVLVLVLVLGCVLIISQKFYAGDVVLYCVIAFYELSALQIVALAIARRRTSMLAALGQAPAAGSAALGSAESPSRGAPRDAIATGV